MLAELDSQDYSEWLAYYNVHPFGDRRDDIRAGLLRFTVAAAHGSKAALNKFIMPECIGAKKTNSDKQVMQLRFMAWAQATKEK